MKLPMQPNLCESIASVIDGKFIAEMSARSVIGKLIKVIEELKDEGRL